MEISKPKIYRLQKSVDGSYSPKEGKFEAPVSRAKTPKIYAAVKDGIIVYVGITTQSLSTRLRQGLKAAGEHGYYGYKWKNHKAIMLYVWVVENIEIEKAALELETLEAELVFLCRSLDGQWPTSQNEIHFHPSTDKHRKLAVSMYHAVRCADG